MSKICTSCGKHEHHAKGQCLICYRKSYNLLHRDNIKKYRKKYYIDNKKTIKSKVKKWCEENPDKYNINQKRHSEKIGITPMSENKECALFLGVHIAERVLKNVFKNVEQMPTGNPGFDFICGKGYKIDVKCSCLRYRINGAPRWGFKIRNNKIADYFLCLAFDNRENLNPMFLWLIPGNEVNNTTGISVSTTTTSRWDKYVLNIDSDEYRYEACSITSEECHEFSCRTCEIARCELINKKVLEPYSITEFRNKVCAKCNDREQCDKTDDEVENSLIAHTPYDA